MPVLDTNFLIALRAGDAGALRLLADLADDELLVPDVVAVEFLTGLHRLEDREAALAGLEEAFTLAHADRAWVLEAAALRSGLRRKGIGVRTADSWIACWARARGTFVVTRNRTDFAPLGVQTRAW